MFVLYCRLLRKIFRQSVVVVCALVFCVCIIQSSKFMYLVSESHATVGQVMSAISLLSVDMLANVIPISIAISVCVILLKFKQSNQLIALQSFGVSRHMLIKPILLMSVIACAFTYSLTLYFSPIALQNFKITRVQLVNNISFPKHSGNLINFGGISVFADKYVGKLNFNGLTIVDNRQNDVFRTYTAKSGSLSNGVIKLNNGEMQEFNKRNKRISTIKFKSHSYNLNDLMKKLNLELTPHETHTSDLIKNYSNLKYKSELHNRIISPLLIIILSLISMLCMCIKNTSSRTNSNIEIIYAIIAIISVEGVALWFSNAISRQEGLIPMYYLTVISSIIILAFAVNWRLRK